MLDFCPCYLLTKPCWHKTAPKELLEIQPQSSGFGYDRFSISEYDSSDNGTYGRIDFDEAVAKLQTLHDEGVVTFERWGEPFLADFFDGITGMSDTPAGLRDMYRNLRALFECPCNDDWKMVCEQKFGDHPALSTLGAHLDAAVGF